MILRPVIFGLALTAVLACDQGELDAQRGTQEPPPPTRVDAQAAIDQSRTTAIVRASARVAPAVVTINVIRTTQTRSADPFFDWFSFARPRERQTASLGSGFVIDSDGHVVTNHHVVAGAELIRVTLPDGRDLEGELIGSDPLNDIAVLRVQDDDLPIAPLGTSEDLVIGEWVVAIGNPFGYYFSDSEPTVTAGVVSAVGRHILPNQAEEGVYLGMIQTDASINPGNSGGPLVNADGEVVGVNASIFSRSGGSEGLGFAIPIDRALRVAADLQEFGEVRRPWLGLTVQPVEGDEFGRMRGVRVATVASGSPAGEAGLQPGQTLVRANGKRLTAPLDFEAVLIEMRAGDPLEVETEEGGGARRIESTLLPSLSARRVEILPGLVGATVTPGLRVELGLQNERGAVLLEVGPQASGLRLQRGNVLLQLNSTVIETVEDARAAFDSLSRGDPVVLVFESDRGTVQSRFRWG